MEERCRGCNNRLEKQDILYEAINDGLCFECLSISLDAAYDPDTLIEPRNRYYE